MGAQGLLGPTAPTEYGGLGLGYFEHLLIMEELSRVCPAIGLSYGAHSNLCVNQISKHGSEEQKKRFLPKLISGEFVGSLAISEPESGSDARSLKLTAQTSGTNWQLNGTKFWITNGSEADLVFVYARTSGPKEEKVEITPFLVETKSAKGFRVGQKIDKLGMRGSPTAELIFEGVEIPAKNMVGQLGRGVYVLMSGLDTERLVLSAGPLGIMQAACEEAFRYAHERKQFGTAIGTFQLLQGKLADMYVRLSSTRALLYNTARAIDLHQDKGKDIRGTSPFTKDCAAAILMAAENATQVALDAIQIFGGNGYSSEYPVGRLLRDAKLYEIGAGTSEIRRWLIGREINKMFSSSSS